jgi:hypothetical protein
MFFVRFGVDNHTPMNAARPEAQQMVALAVPGALAVLIHLSLNTEPLRLGLDLLRGKGPCKGLNDGSILMPSHGSDLPNLTIREDH